MADSRITLIETAMSYIKKGDSANLEDLLNATETLTGEVSSTYFPGENQESTQFTSGSDVIIPQVNLRECGDDLLSQAIQSQERAVLDVLLKAHQKTVEKYRKPPDINKDNLEEEVTNEKNHYSINVTLAHIDKAIATKNTKIIEILSNKYIEQNLYDQGLIRLFNKLENEKIKIEPMLKFALEKISSDVALYKQLENKYPAELNNVVIANPTLNVEKQAQLRAEEDNMRSISRQYDPGIVKQEIEDKLSLVTSKDHNKLQFIMAAANKMPSLYRKGERAAAIGVAMQEIKDIQDEPQAAPLSKFEKILNRLITLRNDVASTRTTAISLGAATDAKNIDHLLKEMLNNKHISQIYSIGKNKDGSKQLVIDTDQKERCERSLMNASSLTQKRGLG